MALPTPSPSGFFQIPNGGFESGATGWVTNSNASIVNESAMSGSWCVKVSNSLSGEFAGDGTVTTASRYPVLPGQSIQVTAAGQSLVGTPGTSFNVGLGWFDASGTLLSTNFGNQVRRQDIGAAKGSVSVTAAAPANAAYVDVTGFMNHAGSGLNTIYMDNFSWNYTFPVVVTLSQPGSSFTELDEIPFRLNVSGLPSGITVTSVNYRYLTWDGADYTGDTSLTTTTESPFSFNAPAMAEDKYAGYALVTLSNGIVLTTASRLFEVSDDPTPPADQREYRASNAYTYLVLS